jgi:hypothetical protein
LPFAGGNIADDLLGCFGLIKKWVSVDLCTSGKEAVDVIDRQEKSRENEGRTYDQSAHEILDAIGAEVKVGICIGELSKGEGGLLLTDGATGEVWLPEDAWSVCGVVKLDALLGALCLLLLDAGSTLSVSDACASTWIQEYLLLDFVDEVELDALGWHLEHRGGLTIIFVELRVCLVAVVICDLNDTVVLETTLESSLGRFRLSGLAKVNSAAKTRRLEQPSIDLAKVVINMQRAHPVVCLEALHIATRWVSKWRVEAVSVPVLAAVVAGDDCALPKRRLVASKAEDIVALVVLKSEVVRLLVMTTTAKI